MLRCFLLMGLVLAVSACSAVQDKNALDRGVIRVPYTFKVETFHDGRTEETLRDALNLSEEYPFEQEEFLQILVQSMNKGLFVSDQATLNVKLLDYAAARQGNKYLVSAFVEMHGFNDQHQKLAGGRFSCVAEGREQFEMGLMIQTALRSGQFVKSSRARTVWADVLRECLEDIAYEFNSEIVGAQGGVK